MAEEKRPVLSLKRKPAKEGRGGLVPAGLEGKESET